MRALVLVDLQYDFLPGGALAVGHGDETIGVAKRVIPRFETIVATQDWHPRDHGSFAANHPGKKVGDVIDLDGLRQVLWPVHCVQSTPGADLAAALDVSRVRQVFRKGTDPGIDSYSAFFDNGHRKSTGLGGYLKARGATELYVAGLATDYCVKFSALDARQLGFRTFVVEDGTRGVELRPGDVASAVEEMRSSRIGMVRSADIRVG